MAKKKSDLMIEAVRYAIDGNILYARGYKRRGDTFSDHVLLTRQELMDLLTSGKNVTAGSRQKFMGTTFDIKDSLYLYEKDNHKVILTRSQNSGEKDYLKGIPVF